MTETREITVTRKPKTRTRPTLTAVWVEADLRPQGRLCRIALTYPTGREDCGYYEISEQDSGRDDCRDFHVAEIDVCEIADGYDVMISMTNPQDHHCTCLGHSHAGHCKHVDALRVLMTETAPEIKVYDPQNDGTADEYRAAHDEVPF